MKKRWVLAATLVGASIGLVGLTTWVGSGDARIPILLVPFVSIYQALNPEKVATVGDSLDQDSGGFTQAVSERFGVRELDRIHAELASEAFRKALEHYNCGEPVPRLRFRMTLFRTSPAYSGARRVECRFSPKFDHGTRDRCLSFGLGYLAGKAFAKVDPDPGAARSSRTTREPRCDCAHRDGQEEWVTFPGPDENLW